MVGQRDNRVLAIDGDGCFQMTAQELATSTTEKIPFITAILNNGYLGMVRQWQELFFEQRYSETDLSDNPDFVALAASFGIPAFTLDRADDCEDRLQRLLATPGPALLHVAIDATANVWPLVPPNRNNAEMIYDPMLQDSEDANALPT
jgi:acetolactate synthase-1/2/3 large subunit